MASRKLREFDTSARTGRLGAAAFLMVALSLVASGCSSNLRTGEVEIRGIAKFHMPAFPKTGANKVEIFNEMHYQPSYRIQEGPRLLSPPNSVPVTGRELTYATLAEYRDLAVPDRVVRAYDPGAAQRVFAVNCMVCHGPTLRGDQEPEESVRAKILPFFDRGPFPADLTAALTQDSTDGELFAWISNGGRQGFAAIERDRASLSPMPEFQRLLTEEERWVLVMYLRAWETSP